MPSGSFSKRARNTDSVVNKKNCGGNKKAGLAPRATGPTEFRNVAFNTHPAVNFKVHKGGLPCPTNYSNNPGGQCSGGVGALASTRNRGCNNLGASKPKSLCSNRQTITWNQAKAQGGVRDCQDLVITEQIEYTITDNDFVVGLLINGNFTIAKTATVTINKNIFESNKSAVGILVTNGSKLINHGTITFKGTINGDYVGVVGAAGILNLGTGTFETSGTITFKDTISGDKGGAYGIFNLGTGTFKQNSGTIIFKDTISGAGAAGIRNSGTIETNGTITFESTISGGAAAGILNLGTFKQNSGTITFKDINASGSGGDAAATGIFSEGTFKQNSGTITFKGTINASGSGVDASAGGIVTEGSGTIETNGTITFESTISGGAAIGISNGERFKQNSGTITFESTISGVLFTSGIYKEGTGTFETNGTITFKDINASGSGDAYGIYKEGTGEFKTNGTITFKNEDLIFYPAAPDPSFFTGKGTIKYGNGTYYPQ